MGRMDVEALMAPRVRDMQPYAPIVPFEVLSKRLGRAPSRIVKLDANENPYGSSPRALDAVAHVAPTAHLSRPGPDGAARGRSPRSWACRWSTSCAAPAPTR